MNPVIKPGTDKGKTIPTKVLKQAMSLCRTMVIGSL